jgi:hypothetical protein
VRAKQKESAAIGRINCSQAKGSEVDEEDEEDEEDAEQDRSCRVVA